jgi:hypothetical protein
VGRRENRGGGGWEEGNEQPIQWKSREKEREIEELQSNIVSGEKRIKTGIF